MKVPLEYRDAFIFANLRCRCCQIGLFARANAKKSFAKIDILLIDFL